MGFSQLFLKYVFIDFESFFWGSKKKIRITKTLCKCGPIQYLFLTKNFFWNFSHYRVRAPDIKWVFLQKIHLKLKKNLLTRKINIIKPFQIILNSFFMMII